MDDFKIVFWIILGLIYLFARKKKQAPPPRPRTPDEVSDYEPSSTPAPKTFEELLREIQGMKEPERPPIVAVDRPPVKRVPDFVDYDDDLPEERKEEEAYDYRKEDKIYQAYEEAKTQAFNRPSLEETVKLEDTVVRFKQFEGYQQEERRDLAGEILRDFRDPQGFRKAFIMSEILKRRF